LAKLGGQEDYPIYFGAGPEILRIAGDLRKSMTPAERLLWKEIRNRKINGFSFRRQHPVKDFVVDFFCYHAMLIIEIDGDVHDDAYQKERDDERMKIIKKLGINEIRFKNEEVINNLEQVIKRIAIELNQK